MKATNYCGAFLAEIMHFIRFFCSETGNYRDIDVKDRKFLKPVLNVTNLITRQRIVL